MLTPRTRIRRGSRGSYEPAVIHGILDEALVCHVAFAEAGQPYAIPTLHARIGDEVFLHGAYASRLLRAAVAGAPLCLTVTLLDGLVLARSAFHHSVNYRSVVVLGVAREIVDPDAKRVALRALIERIVPGRWQDTRPPTTEELAATCVVAVPIHEASAKQRRGPPEDAAADYDLPYWAGVIPTWHERRPPVPDPAQPTGRALPDYLLT
jgi:nitroimidazol reductase NimA-like FMN-containing flavoprotein (pyridoxamine 5'-phosphate oxidase superfamily)